MCARQPRSSLAGRGSASSERVSLRIRFAWPHAAARHLEHAPGHPEEPARTAERGPHGGDSGRVDAGAMGAR
jgi:hypothetical protein